MYHFVVPHIDSSMGISLLVWNELPIKVIVVPSDKDIPRLYVLENVKYVVARYEIWLVLVENHWNQPRGGNLYLAEPGEELCPDAVEKLLHGSIIPQFFVMDDVPNPLDGKNGYLADFCPASRPLM